MKNFISLFTHASAIIALLIISSCGSGVGTGINDCTGEDLSNSADVFLNAAAVYSQDPSADNCRAYKNSLEEYIEILDACSIGQSASRIEAEELMTELGC